MAASAIADTQTTIRGFAYFLNFFGWSFSNLSKSLLGVLSIKSRHISSATKAICWLSMIEKTLYVTLSEIGSRAFASPLKEYHIMSPMGVLMALISPSSRCGLEKLPTTNAETLRSIVHQPSCLYPVAAATDTLRASYNPSPASTSLLLMDPEPSKDSVNEIGAVAENSESTSPEVWSRTYAFDFSEKLVVESTLKPQTILPNIWLHTASMKLLTSSTPIHWSPLSSNMSKVASRT